MEVTIPRERRTCQFRDQLTQHYGGLTSTDTLVIDAKEVHEVAVGEKGSEKRTIVTVGGRAAEGYHTGEDEDRSCHLRRGLLDHGLLESLITDGRLDDGDLVLRLPKEVSICSIALLGGERRTFFSSCLSLWMDSDPMLMFQRRRCELSFWVFC